jgi:hypothetical protein
MHRAALIMKHYHSPQQGLFPALFPQKKKKVQMIRYPVFTTGEVEYKPFRTMSTSHQYAVQWQF